MALAAAGSVNSTYWPGVRLTADRPDASAARVYAVVLGPMIVPFVAAFSASCSTKPGSAPRPETSDGSRGARLPTGAEAAAPPALAKAGLPQTILRPTVATVTTVAAAFRRRRLDHVGSAPVLLRDIDYLPLSGWHLRTLEAKRTPRVN